MPTVEAPKKHAPMEMAASAGAEEQRPQIIAQQPMIKVCTHSFFALTTSMHALDRYP
ncbi:hypothetical protein AUP68_03778 [Ilyonectria robusta]